MAEIGHEVIGLDIDESKIAALRQGRAWFQEPELDGGWAVRVLGLG